jgi:hypothetical protein
MTALLGGQVDFAFETVAVALPHIRAGKLRALGTPSPQRLRQLADVPTLQEAGFAGLAAEGWMGVFAPPGTTQAAVQRINAAVNRVLLREVAAAGRPRRADRGGRPATPAEAVSGLQRWRRESAGRQLSQRPAALRCGTLGVAGSAGPQARRVRGSSPNSAWWSAAKWLRWKKPQRLASRS